ncbi:uncharacterized protein N7515_006853 [Penicillium bovifimosum]|uniref:Acyl-CoA thioesterase II n=1 Tax=Penicillium bovifimosum TaxID=126998 RepID=A0A9W9GVG7_9EURO|nr:uncharacterized protein N7515_006853 [Penicillium bovifimosum]KAJ5130814.1 hypothetical protein N7515_006853 [Penicillium bovifimosum]
MDNTTPIERQLEVKPASDAGPDVFTHRHTLWQLQGARGIFGGITIGQSLSAAQETIAPEFDAHSMHCTFVSAGSATETIYYHVERVRDGKSFIIRAVKAIQNDRTIFLATISFARTSPESTTNLHHAEPKPPMVPKPPAIASDDNEDVSGTPYMNQSVGMTHSTSEPSAKRMHQWIKTRGKISSKWGSRAHLAALAFMSDSYFLAGLPQSHNVWSFVNPPVTEFYDREDRLALASPIHTPIPRPHVHGGQTVSTERRVGMMVSLDHSIHFHQTRDLKVDDWLLTEVQTHWAGQGRGLVSQKIWDQDGTLLAACTQEGIVRLERRSDDHNQSDVASKL